MGQDFREDEPGKCAGGEERDVWLVKIPSWNLVTFSDKTRRLTCIATGDCERETCRRITGEVYKKTEETSLVNGLLSSNIKKSFWLLAPSLKWMC
jgi:hypothetical protein